MQNCKYCGKELTEKQKRYCSRSCRNKDNPRQATEKATIPKTCEICGKAFLAKRKDRKYCSDTCNWKARLQRQPRRPQPGQTYWRKHRFEVLERQDDKCWLCQKTIDMEEKFAVHHLKGDHDPFSDDVVALHSSCHNLMHQVSIIIDGDRLCFLGQAFEFLSNRKDYRLYT